MTGPVSLMLGLLAGLPAAGPADAPASPEVSPEAFVGWFDAAMRGSFRLPEEVRSNAKGFQYVLVGGFGNERNPGYFVQNARELKAMGVPEASIHFVFPSSQGTVDENAGYVRKAFHKVADRGKGPLVVVGHSRGACDALAFALREPGFVRERVAAMFLVQGPFGGSGAADRVMGEGPEADRRLGPVKRGVTNVLTRRVRAAMELGQNGGITGLTREASRDYWTDALKRHRKAAAVVGPKTYYVISSTAPANRRVVQRAVATYLETYYGENDGVVALEDQTLPGVGTVLAVLDAGHSDLTHRAPASRATRRARRALMEAVVMAVGRLPDDEADD